MAAPGILTAAVSPRRVGTAGGGLGAGAAPAGVAEGTVGTGAAEGTGGAEGTAGEGVLPGSSVAPAAGVPGCTGAPGEAFGDGTPSAGGGACTGGASAGGASGALSGRPTGSRTGWGAGTSPRFSVSPSSPTVAREGKPAQPGTCHSLPEPASAHGAGYRWSPPRRTSGTTRRCSRARGRIEALKVEGARAYPTVGSRLVQLTYTYSVRSTIFAQSTVRSKQEFQDSSPV
jgi:hypothetical protein